MIEIDSLHDWLVSLPKLSKALDLFANTGILGPEELRKDEEEDLFHHTGCWTNPRKNHRLPQMEGLLQPIEEQTMTPPSISSGRTF